MFINVFIGATILIEGETIAILCRLVEITKRGNGGVEDFLFMGISHILPSSKFKCLGNLSI